VNHRKILLAYNGSTEGKRALLECGELANFLQAETHLAAIATVRSSMFVIPGIVPEQLIEYENERARAAFEEGITAITGSGIKVVGHFAVGEPVAEICRLARELSVDLIVVGHKKKTSFAARWWKGSIGASLLDQAPCSVLIAQTNR
jgi:nucleotide-binding universal stress UspA family protein